MKRLLLLSVAFAAALNADLAAADPHIAKYLGAEPQSFAEAGEAVDVLKTELAAKNVRGLANLIGLNPDEIGKSDGFDERLTELQDAAKERVKLVERGPERRIIVLGDLIWPFPFPLVKLGDKWSFDPEAGLEEILDRRIGENELEAISTSRASIIAQELYFADDRDGDGVREYAQVLKSPEGTKDGLYWPASDDGQASPAGAFVVDAKAEAAPSSPDGYYGYRYRILTKQGANVAGGAYDYVINGNMIGGFALIASPARYGETGIMTFLISHHGSVYEKDLGPDTAVEASKIVEFNPDKSWKMVDF